MTAPTVVLVWRTGGEYQAPHVTALVRQLRTWGAARVVVLSDAPPLAGIEWRALTYTWHHGRLGWWAKMEMFAPAHDDLGAFLYLDLDTMVVGDLETVGALAARHSEDRLPVLLEDFYRVGRVQSGMMYWPVSARRRTWAWFAEDAQRRMREHRGDGECLDALWRPDAVRWQHVAPGLIVSYKAHIRLRRGQTVPPDAAVVCFHGRPRPWDSPLWKRYHLHEDA